MWCSLKSKNRTRADQIFVLVTIREKKKKNTTTNHIMIYMHMTWLMDYQQFKNVTDYYKNINYRQSKRMSERLQIECKWVIGWEGGGGAK